MSDEDKLRAVVLSIDPLNIHEASNLDRDKPSSVRLISPAFLTGESSGGFLSITGDLMKWSDWKSLSLNIGSTSGSTSETIPLNFGWRYIYNFMTKEFDVYDEGGFKVRHLTDVLNIQDLGIDFDVHKNRNFIVILSEKEGSETHQKEALFIFPVRLKPLHIEGFDPKMVSYGVQNDVPMVYEDGLVFGHIRYIDLEMSEYNNPLRIIETIEMECFGTGIKNPINYDKNLWHNYMYIFGYSPQIRAEKVLTNLGAYEEQVDFVLSKLSLSLYPYLHPCIAGKETVNNRPVYEPWMIDPCPFPYNKRTTDKDNIFDEYLFDLMPRWE